MEEFTETSGLDRDLDVLYSAETEEVLTVNVEDIPTLDIIPNLRWLVPLALDEGNLGARLDYAPTHGLD